jgi:hypothetical protein
MGEVVWESRLFLTRPAARTPAEGPMPADAPLARETKEPRRTGFDLQGQPHLLVPLSGAPAMKRQAPRGASSPRYELILPRDAMDAAHVALNALRSRSSMAIRSAQPHARAAGTVSSRTPAHQPAADSFKGAAAGATRFAKPS